jgi:hypothetical protein
MRRLLLQQELLRLRLTQPPTLTPEGPIQARPGSLAVPKERPPWWFFSLCAGGCESDSAGEHLWATIGTGFTGQPSCPNRQPIVLVKVLIHSATKWIACQADPQAGTLLTGAHLALPDPHAPPGLSPEGHAEIFYGRAVELVTSPGMRSMPKPATVRSATQAARNPDAVGIAARGRNGVGCISRVSVRGLRPSVSHQLW